MEVIAGSPRLGPIGLAVVVVIANGRLKVDPVIGENADRRTSLLPLCLPIGRRRVCARSNYVSVVVDWITPTVDDVT